MNTITAVQSTFNMDLSAKAKIIYNYLAFRSNDRDNSCFPALKRIARECGMSVSSVQRGLNELLLAGHISKRANYRANGGQTSNIYTIITGAKKIAETAKENLKKYIAAIEKRKEEKRQQQICMKLFITNKDNSPLYTSNNTYQNILDNKENFVKALQLCDLNRGAIQFE